MTNQLCLQQQCGRLYKKLLQQLNRYETTHTNEKKWIEWGFGITTKTWFGIQQESDNYLFEDQQEEITFYKVVKPRFFALMDYFTLLYKSVLFQPDDTEAKKEYWNNELASCENFLSRYRSFFRYYEQGTTSMDHIYFIQENNQHPLVFGISENSRRAITSYSYLLARLFSIRKYQLYIKKKLCLLTNSPLV